ncbi:MAG: SbmA/BacA-like family transporter, partial [Bdellovibrionales bacterium]
LLSLGLLLIVLLNLAVDLEINAWSRRFFDALEQKHANVALVQAAIFIPLVAASVSIGVLSVYFRMSIQRKWRAWLNLHVTEFWLSKGRYFRLNFMPGDHENAECRISEDLRVATDAPIDFAAGLTAAVLSAGVFIAILWNVGGALTFEAGAWTVTIPGFLVIGAMIYAMIASTFVIIVGKRFVPVIEGKNQSEAEYRCLLTNLRENGESMGQGLELEARADLDQIFSRVLRQWRELCSQLMRMTVVSQASRLLSPIVPVILMAPKYLTGSVTLGEVMQTAGAFVVVQGSFGWIVDNYPRFADWLASVRRVASLLASLDILERIEAGGVRPIQKTRPAKTEPVAET